MLTTRILIGYKVLFNGAPVPKCPEQVEMVETSTGNKNKQAFTTNFYSSQVNV